MGLSDEICEILSRGSERTGTCGPSGQPERQCTRTGHPTHRVEREHRLDRKVTIQRLDLSSAIQLIFVQ